MKLTQIILCLLIFVHITAFANQRKVLIIGIDGVRSDVLIKLNTPFFQLLSKEGFGTFNSWHEDIPMSAPSWSSILCGVYHEKHGVLANELQGNKYSEYPMLPAIAKSIDPSITCGIYTEWGLLKDLCANNKWDQMLVGEMANTSKTCNESSQWLKESNLDFYFTYFGAADYWGHRFGFSLWNPFYRNSIAQISNAVSELISSINMRPTYNQEDWLILITTDHGGHGFRHGTYTKSDRQVFWFAYSDRIKSQLFETSDFGNYNTKDKPPRQRNLINFPVQCDIAVTALHHLLIESNCNLEDCIEPNFDGKSWLKDMNMLKNKSYEQLLVKK